MILPERRRERRLSGHETAAVRTGPALSRTGQVFAFDILYFAHGSVVHAAFFIHTNVKKITVKQKFRLLQADSSRLCIQ